MFNSAKDCVRWVLLLALVFAMPQVAFAQNADRLLEATAVVRGMSEAALEAMVPLQSGLHFVGCPNCTNGHQEQQLGWSIERPDEVVCKHCQHRYPSEKYPMKEAVNVKTPLGQPVKFEYWADKSGYRFFFKARRDDEVRKYLATQTLSLARLYAATGDKAHARRAAVILDRFAQVFPGWCYHYDYPFQQKIFYSGDVQPSKFRPGFRSARWNWWAYMDIPSDLVDSYQLIRNSGVLKDLSKERGVDVEARIRKDLLRNAGEQVIANKDELTNMSPTAWRALIKLAQVIDEPRYVHEVVRRLKQLIETQFFYDGFWSEGTPSYGSQTVNSLEVVLRDLQGYTDPPGFVDSIDKKRFDKLDLKKEFPLLELARSALAQLRLPDGRGVPVHDTWAATRRSRRETPVSAGQSYMLPALGHACLRSGTGPDRSEFHLSWSGGYGHQHADLLSLLVFANKRELISDLGYTHTAYRSWTIATVAHNTVVIDGRSQFGGSRATPTDGNLRWIDTSSPHVQVVSSDAKRAYPGLAKLYRRTLVIVNTGENSRYAVDLFDVEGGQTHDYFLHGDADEHGRMMTSRPLEKLETLLPAGYQWKPTTNEGQVSRIYEPHYAYGFLRNLQTAPAKSGEPLTVDWLTSEGGQAGLRVTLLPEADSQLVLGENPSIRAAGEDDAQLEKHMRQFLMLRHRAGAGRSAFLSVIESTAKTPLISSVKRLDLGDGAIGLVVNRGERVDLIGIGTRTAKAIATGVDNTPQAQFQGEIGVLTLRKNKVEQAYSLGEGGWKFGEYQQRSTAPVRAELTGCDSGSLVLGYSGKSPPPAGAVVRLITADGWVYPYNVKSTAIEGDKLRIHVVEGPGFDFDGSKKRLRFRSFPQREHSGDINVEWLTPAIAK